MQANPSHPKARNRHAPAFSLIEVLAVMAVISILLVAAVPVFSNSSNNARRSSSEIVKAQLLRAHAHAIASGNPTAVAIPTISTGTRLGARAITSFEVGKDGTNYVLSTVPDEDGSPPQLQRWEILPGNFHFLSSSHISSSKPTLMDLSSRLETADGSCHVIVFSPSGRIVRPAPGEAVRLAFAQAARTGDSLTLTQRSGGTPVFELIEINRLTGRTRRIDP